MVVRILKNAKTFSAVKYNEQRVKQGEASFLASRNFGSLGSLFESAKEYKDFMESWSSKNPNIKNPQLHAVISCEGEKYSKEQLLKIGEEWLKKMGYGEVPYMIYFHSNTNNNHIHIVACRVDSNGKKINDSFEKEKAVRMMDKVMGEDRNLKTRKDVSSALHYSYSSSKQFQAILESLGYKVTEQNSTFSIFNGTDTLLLNKDLVDFCQNRYSKPVDKKEKLKTAAIIKKYARQLSREQFQEYMKSKFGLSFVFFGKKNEPYGYCVIDHKNRRVYTGKEILSIKELNKLFNTKPEDVNYNLYIGQLLNSKPLSNTYSINKSLKKFGVVVENKNVVDKLTGEVLCQLDKETIDKIAYNNKLFFCAKKFSPSSKLEFDYLARRFDISSDDLKQISKNENENDNISYYSELINTLLENGKLKEGIYEQEIRIVNFDGEYLLIDNAHDRIISMNRLNVDRGLLEVELYGTRYFTNEEYADEQYENNAATTLIDELADWIDVSEVGTGSEKPRKRRKK